MEPLDGWDQPFSGCSTGGHRLTWAQRSLADLSPDIGNDGLAVATQVFGALPEGLRIDEVREAVGHAVARHESLRTRYEPEVTETRQAFVAGEGRVRLSAFEAGGRDPETVANEVAAGLAADLFTPEELPVRPAVILDGGRPSAVALAVRHASADGLAGDLILEAIREACRPSGNAPSAAWTPAELAAFEASPEGRAQAVRSGDYLTDALTVMVDSSCTRRGPASQGTRAGLLIAAGAAEAVRHLARHHRVSEAMVFTAAHGRVLGRLAGSSVVAVQTATANRGRTQLRASVAHLTQLVPAVLDVSSASFGDACRASGLALMKAAQVGHHDPDMLRAAVDRVRHETGTDPKPAYSLNLRALRPTELRLHHVTRDRREDAEPPPAYSDFLVEKDRPPMDLGFAVWGLNENLELSAAADAALFSGEELRALLQEVADEILHAAEEAGWKAEA
ncbi:condensation domain-containing protein [Streptomyces sp. NBC_00453]|uniref:condensation domain-containing protein n=1 Tax=Streptomyces sp. NBC_00453 TaxID=2903653 RepID=UPI002E212435